jgi:hypothetical protein
MNAAAPSRSIALPLLVALGALVGCAPAPAGLRAHPVSADALRAEGDDPPRGPGGAFVTSEPSGGALMTVALCKEAGQTGGPLGFSGEPPSHGVFNGVDHVPPSGGQLGRVRVQAQGDLLYVLGAERGLATFDVADPKRPRLLGRRALTKPGIEIFARGTSVFVVEPYEGREGELRLRIEGFDARDPARLRATGALDYAGSLLAARAFDGALYLAVLDNVGCADCPAAPRTTLVAIGLEGPGGPREIDRVSSNRPPESLHAPVVVITPRYAFVADQLVVNRTGSLRVVGLGGPGGRFTAGNEVRLEGVIEGAGQLDERGGVLRVVGRAYDLGGDGSGVYLSTFRLGPGARLERRAVVAAETGGFAMMHGARFDGDRAYAALDAGGLGDEGRVAAFDFGGPAGPRALGLTSVPFRPLHVEPRGGHVVAFGYRTDPTTEAGWVHASLFDVSGAGAPAQKKAVRFEGYPWHFDDARGPSGERGAVVEPGRGLLALPYGGQNVWGVCERPGQGYRLLEIAGDDLVDRGTLEHAGKFRGALWHRGVLFSASAEALRGFDVASPGAPTLAAERVLAAPADALVVAGDRLVRASVGQDGDALTLHVSRPGEPESIAGSVEIAALAERGGPRCRKHGFVALQLFANGDVVYAVWPADEWSEPGPPHRRPTPARHAYAVAVDVSDPARPRALGHARVPAEGFSAGHEWPVTRQGAGPAARVGSALAISSQRWSSCERHESRLTFVDFADPTSPRVASSIEIARGAYASYVLAARDGRPLVLTSHAEALPGSPVRLRHWLDRVDARDLAAPALLPRVNLPGALVAEAGSRLVTLDGQGGWGEPEHALHVVDLGDGGRARVAAWFRAPAGEAIYRAEAGADRVYLPLAPVRGGALRQGASKASLLALSGLSGGPPRAFVYDLDVAPAWRRGYTLVGVEGDRALLEPAAAAAPWPLFAVLDAGDPASPRLLERGALRDVASGAVTLGGRAILGLRGHGVQAFAPGP